MISLIYRNFPRKKGFSAVLTAMILAGLFGISPSPALAQNCEKNPDHKNCSGGGGGGDPPANFNPEIVWVDGSLAISVADGNGSNPTTILSRERDAGIIKGVSWSPDGTEILITRAEGSQGSGGVYRLPIFSEGQFAPGTPSLVAASDDWRGGNARWSPVPAPDDKQWIAYTKANQAFLLDPVTDIEIPLTNTENRVALALTWSHDGSRIAVWTDSSGNLLDEDIVVYSLGTDLPMGEGDLVVTSSVSLLLNNSAITDPNSNAAKLADDAVNEIQEDIFSIDWANKDDRIVVGTNSDTFWILPVPAVEPQQAVADGTVLAFDSEISRLVPVWSPDDTALLYRRNGSGGTCSVPSPTKKGKNRILSNFVIGMLDNPHITEESGDVPDRIECDDENVLNSTGNRIEWWRGGVGFVPPAP